MASILFAIFCLQTLAEAKKNPRPIQLATNLPLETILGNNWTNEWIVPATNKTTQYRIEIDPISKKQAIVTDEKTTLIITSKNIITSNVEISFLICPACPNASPDSKAGSGSISFGKKSDDPKDRGITITISGNKDNNAKISLPALPSNRFSHSDTNTSAGNPQLPQIINYQLKAFPVILPTLDPTVRAHIEKDMAELPWSQDKWFHIRCILGGNWIRAFVDDRLIIDHISSSNITHGFISITLQKGARTSLCSIKPLETESPFFEKIPLTAYVRAYNLCGSEKKPVGLSSNTLPSGGEKIIQNIPFIFADKNLSGGADHIDVGRSFVREGIMQGYGPVKSEGNRVGNAFIVDPARIRMRIPNGRYNAAYVIAAFDDEPNNIPLFSLQFFRPNAGFSVVFEGAAPSWQSAGDPEATPVPVELSNGKKANLWLIKVPLDPGKLSSFADMGALELEITKKVEQYRSYPDPILYGWHGAGLPSGVHIYAITLQRPAIDMEVNPSVFGHVWEEENPSYNVILCNKSDASRKLKFKVETISDNEKEKTEQSTEIFIKEHEKIVYPVKISVKNYGFHRVSFTMTDGQEQWTENRTFVKLRKDTRNKEWNGIGPLFGYWSYHGGHYTPPKDKIEKIMRMAGARAPTHPANAWVVSPQHWAAEEPLDIQKVQAFKTNIIAKFTEKQGTNPLFVTFFAEPHISRDLTAGNLASYWNEQEPPLTEEEQKNIKIFFNTARIAAEAVREKWPNVPILIPWGDPLFVVPLLRAGFPKELIDGSGLDVPGFERLPEQQLKQISFHRLYCLREEYKKAGILNPKLWFIEGTFVPTEPGACTWEEQAAYHDRWALICMGYGVDRFYSGWFAYDCCNYYGSEHYGGCGIQRRIPYCDPKPAYAHYATMTRNLECAKWEKWIKTGSLSTYCIKFTKPPEKGGNVHVIWTLRGKRPVRFVLPSKGKITVTDPNDNDTVMETDANNSVIVTAGVSPIYISGVEEFLSVEAGIPDHSDSVEWTRNRNRLTWQTGPANRGPEIMHEQPIALLGDGTWKIDNKKDVFDEIYENNCFDIKVYRGKMSVYTTIHPDRPVSALAVKLEKQEKEIPLMPWYSVIRPDKPIVIPGKAKALGLWGHAASDWGRVIYCLKDANDEMWISIGAKDQWNCNDGHSWSYFNFDGWRYLRFELPGNAPWDNFREYGTTWWRYAGGKKEGVGIVDLPLRIEKIIIERRTHILYVNDIQPTGAETNDVLLADLIAEYGTRTDTLPEVIKLSQLRMPLPETIPAMENPIAKMKKENTLPPSEITGIRNPDWGYDGTVCLVDFKEMPDAEEYQIWVSAYKDGSGAVEMANKIKKSGATLRNLAPAMKLYLWITYTGKQSEEDKKAKIPPQKSKPSKVREIELIDAFGQK